MLGSLHRPPHDKTYRSIDITKLGFSEQISLSAGEMRRPRRDDYLYGPDLERLLDSPTLERITTVKEVNVACTLMTPLGRVLAGNALILDS